MSTEDLLREPWLSPEGQVLVEEVTARLFEGRPLERIGLAGHQGRWDLRCVGGWASVFLAREIR